MKLRNKTIIKRRYAYKDKNNRITKNYKHTRKHNQNRQRNLRRQRRQRRQRRGGYSDMNVKEAVEYLREYEKETPYLEKNIKDLELEEDFDEDIYEPKTYVPPPNKISTMKKSWNPFSRFTRKKEPLPISDKPKPSWLSRFTRKNKYPESITVIKKPYTNSSSDETYTDSSSDDGVQPIQQAQPIQPVQPIKEEKKWYQNLFSFSGGKTKRRRVSHNKTYKMHKMRKH